MNDAAMTHKTQRWWRRVACLLLCIGVYWSASGLLQLHEVFFQAVAPLQAETSAAPVARESSTNFNPSRQYDRLVVVLIDALRADMVLGSEALYGQAAAGGVPSQELNRHMQFTRSLFSSGVAAGYVAHASVPTVTMPRLKALLSGKPPAFIDILKNFNAAALDDENVIHLLREQDFRIVFYGDDTWLKLFPDTFQRHEATSGFYTRDTVEVDDNVTRHLKDELDPAMIHPKSRDWDVLVLHYLGLDHVGHLRGPRSTLMEDKLHEMDHVVKQVYESVHQQDSVRQREATQRGEDFKPSLIVLCSDHGMSEIGNHGGATVEESSALMAFMRGDRAALVDIADTTTVTRRLQVDLVPTLTTLFGLRIPTYSTGLLLDSIIERSGGSTEVIKALYANLVQLRTLASIKFPAYAKEDDTGGLEEKTLKRLADTGSIAEEDQQLISELRAMCSTLQERVAASDGSEYDTNLIGAGVLTLLVVFAGSLFVLANTTPNQGSTVTLASSVAVLSFVVTIVSLTSTSSIENEHATMFFFLTSLLAAMGIDCVRRHRSDAVNRETLALVLVSLVCVRVLRERSQVINFARLNNLSVDTSQPGNEFATDDSLSVWYTGPLLATWGIPSSVCLAIIFSSLVNPKGKTEATPWLVWPLLAVGVGANWWCSSLVAGDAASVSIDLAARLVYGAALSLLAVGAATKTLAMTSEMALWLVICVVQKPANLPTLAVLCVLLRALSKLQSGDGSRSVLVTGALTLWLAWGSFFALGNSHLVTTIDISQAYHGLQGYSQSLVGLLTFLNVFSGPLVTLVGSLQWRNASESSDNKQWILLSYQALRVAVYGIVVFFMRFHLFIWSVFAPKMLYEVVFSVVIAVFAALY